MIIGCDISHHQGEAIDWNKMAAAGVKFIYIKCSQGDYIKDHDFETNIMGAYSVGIIPGPYHYVTTNNPAKQYDWYIRCMGDYMFGLPPALDVEERGVTEAIVDSIGRKLTSWMEDQEDVAAYKYPTIYTNNGMGNAIFKSKSMARYPLWIAHWPGPSVPLTKPTLPSVWKGGPYFIWQDKVLPSGAEYGVPGALDHDVWGTLYPFPDAPPQKRALSLTGTGKDGAKWTGKMEVA